MMKIKYAYSNAHLLRRIKVNTYSNGIQLEIHEIVNYLVVLMLAATGMIPTRAWESTSAAGEYGTTVFFDCVQRIA